MIYRIVCILLYFLTMSHACAEQTCPPASTAVTPNSETPAIAYKMYVDDGQLASWDFRAYVVPDLPPGVKPILCLYPGHAVTSPMKGEQSAREARLIATHQTFVGGAREDGTDASHLGTLLTFAPVSDLIEPWKPVKRVRPVITWTGAENVPVTVIASHVVNLGHAPTAWAISIGAMVLCLALIILFARLSNMPAISLLLHDDGHLSLSKAQMAWWTIVVGVVMIYFAGISVDLPDLPSSIVVLMGMSLVTTGISYQASGTKATLDQTPASANKRVWSLGDLIADTDNQDAGLSLSRAQVLLWTIILSGVFVAKSVLMGKLWSIPWELVALMGVSQAGYVIPKVTPKTNP
jgi:hypothetical protein